MDLVGNVRRPEPMKTRIHAQAVEKKTNQLLAKKMVTVTRTAVVMVLILIVEDLIQAIHAREDTATKHQENVLDREASQLREPVTPAIAVQETTEEINQVLAEKMVTVTRIVTVILTVEDREADQEVRAQTIHVILTRIVAEVLPAATQVSAMNRHRKRYRYARIPPVTAQPVQPLLRLQDARQETPIQQPTTATAKTRKT